MSVFAAASANSNPFQHSFEKREEHDAQKDHAEYDHDEKHVEDEEEKRQVLVDEGFWHQIEGNNSEDYQHQSNYYLSTTEAHHFIESLLLDTDSILCSMIQIQ